MSNKVHETDVKDCHVTVEKIGNDLYDSSVSYKVHNANGVHVASPTWQKIGSAVVVKNFILREVGHAQQFNKPNQTKELPGDD